MLRGVSSTSSLFWLTMLPAVALAVGGRRAANIVLVGTLSIDIAALLIMEHRWVEPLLEHQMKNGAGTPVVGTALCGMCDNGGQAARKEAPPGLGMTLPSRANFSRIAIVFRSAIGQTNAATSS